MKIRTKIYLIVSCMTIFNIFIIGFIYMVLNFHPFQDWLVTTALTTGRHQYLAYILYDKEQINEIENRNKISEFNSDSDLNQITINATEKKTTYKNFYEQQVLEREEGQQYKMVELTLDSDGVQGYVVFVYNPKQIQVVLSKRYPYRGQTVMEFTESYDAVLAINGGGHTYSGTSNIYPEGNVISDGVVVSSKNADYMGAIAFTDEGKMLLTYNDSVENLKSLNVTNSLEFHPFLIVNGEPANITGNGGYGVHPRTAIGQRTDGIVIMMVIDGRNNSSSGADMNKLIELFQRYEAYNAANLDGGGSSTMVENGRIVNTPFGDGAQVTERYVSTAIILKREE